MNFSEYQSKARKTAVYPDVGNNSWYPVLGLCEEVVEVTEIVKKNYRDDGGARLVVVQDRQSRGVIQGQGDDR